MLRVLTSRAVALIKHPNAHAAFIACVLIWAYLYQHNAVLYTAALFLGSCLVCTASVSPMAECWRNLSSKIQDICECLIPRPRGRPNLPTSLEVTESIKTRIRDPTPIHTSHTASIYLRIQKIAETNTEITIGSDHS